MLTGGAIFALLRYIFRLYFIRINFYSLRGNNFLSININFYCSIIVYKITSVREFQILSWAILTFNFNINIFNFIVKGKVRFRYALGNAIKTIHAIL